MPRFLRSPALVAMLLGAAAACGFAPLDLWPLTLVCFAAWMALVHRAETLKQALWFGWTFGVGHFTINDNWIQHAFDFQRAMPPVLGYFAAVGLALYLAVYPMMAAGLAWRLRGRGADAAYVLAFAAAWMVTEWLRATMFTGYAWDPLGVTWLPVIGIARLAAFVGTYAMSGLAVLSAGALLLAYRRRWGMACALVPAACVAILSAFWTDAPPARAGTPLIRVVQPNIGQEDRDPDDGRRVLDALSKLSGRPGPVPRLIVWPEGVVRDLVEDGYPFWVYGGIDPYDTRRRIARLLGPRDRLLFGGTALQFADDGSITKAANSVFAIDPAADLIGRYDKAHLVPYGEYLPMPWLLRPLGLARLVPGDIDFSDGPGPQSLTLPGFGAIGVQVCYEIIFSGQVVDETHRPRLLFNPSNDAWFGAWGPPQHLAQARMRAIEEGLPIVRATPTGISAVIAADGRLLATVGHDEAGAIQHPIPPALVPTPFARMGNVLPALIVLALAAGAVALARRRR